MNFAWPFLLWLLLVPAGLLAWELTHRRRAAGVPHPKILQAEAGTNSLKLSTFAYSAAPARQARPRVWLCCGLALAVVALARPQWGRIEEPVFDQSREILLAIDLSRSMLTPDVRPSRLDRSKLLIQSLLEKLAGERVGLMVFAGTAFLQSPLSADYEILREFLPELNPGYLPQGGSNYTALIEASLQAFGSTTSADRFLVILSDGEATDDDWKSKVEELKKKGVRVIGLGVGTAAGSMIPDGTGGFIKDERGAVVRSKLESATLEELARATNGVYRDASTWVDLADLVTQTIETGQKGSFVEKRTVRYVERFQWPLALGLWCLLVSFYYEFPVRPRVRDLKLAASGAPPKPAAAKAAVAALALLLVGPGLMYPTIGYAAATLGAPPGPSVAPVDPGSAPAAEPAPPPEPPMLAKVVGRLAAAEKQTARDWAELGRETVTWGSGLQSQQQAVPEGPVRDALAAVDLGAKLDPKATDWPKLREELEALLKKSEEQQKQDQQQQQQNQQQNQDQKQQDQKQDQQKQDQSQKQNDPSAQNQQQNQPPDQKEGDPKQQDQKQEPPQKQGGSAFGDMNEKNQPPQPPPGDTQKVGGTPEKREEQKEQADPALAMPLQKLERVRDQDSPAQLFQLMEADKRPPPKPGKDW
jgi:Ca-activated chloride channel family protein